MIFVVGQFFLLWRATITLINVAKESTHYVLLPTFAQKLMGHSSPMVTLSIYTGFRDDEIAETGKALRKTLGL
jgi:hypothetical protein